MTNFGRIRERRTAKGEPRFEVDFRTEVARLGRPAKVGRVYSMPTLAGPRVFKIREDAEAALHYIRGKVAEGVPLITVLESFRPTGAYHVLSCADRFIERQREQADAREISHKSVDQLEGQIRNHWKPKWEGISIYEITTRHLDDWARELRKTGLSPAMTVNVLSGMRSMMRWMYRRQELAVVPDFPSIKVPEHAPKLLSRRQQDAVLAEIPDKHKGIFLALADLMLRPNEARALRPEVYEVVTDRAEKDPAAWMTIKRAADGDTRAATVREWTKTGNVRRLPASDRLAEWIAEHVPADARITREFLFVAPRGGMISHGFLKRVWGKACRDAGVREVPVREGTRHSSATAARRAKVPLDLIRLFLGHTDAKTTERYSKHENLALVQLVRRRK
jgi:integrase